RPRWCARRRRLPREESSLAWGRPLTGNRRRVADLLSFGQRLNSVSSHFGGPMPIDEATTAGEAHELVPALGGRCLIAQTSHVQKGAVTRGAIELGRNR